jgi:hypothetical protein
MEKVSILREICQYLPYLRYHFAFIGKGHLVSDLRMDNISGAAEVCNHRNSAAGESFEDYSRTVIAKSGEYHHVG